MTVTLTWITPDELSAQVHQALAQWPFIPQVEGQHGLPRGTLLAVGSVETNLTNETGDDAPRDINGVQQPGPWGYGIWQRDRQWSGPIPADWMSNVAEQADWAAAKLAGLIAHYPTNLQAAFCAYNAGAGAVDAALADGRDPNSVTTGGHYGLDALQRLQWIQANVPAPTTAPPQTEDHLMDVVIHPASGRAAAVVVGENAAGYIAVTATADELAAGQGQDFWHGLGGACKSIACAFRDENTLLVTCVGATDHHIYAGEYAVHTGTFSGWKQLPGKAA